MSLKANGFEIKNIITWYKTNAMPNLTRRVLTHTTEFVIWAVKGKGWIFNYEILKELNPEKQKDGTSKQMRDLWSMPLGFSNENDIVLDPFAGSGTTPYIAQKYNRNFIAIEKEEKYIKAIEKRVAVKHKKEEQKQPLLSKKCTTNCRREEGYSTGLFNFNYQTELNEVRNLKV
ncbi:Modification methylase [hydrothermal vent metagenome]|uniref:Modification methylase n=1 Tax=hydrothermal vent metagenome TaxID=652676 RepID=A0A1W1C5V3_9ZZZZ